jgi:hypothetical protein
MLANIISAFLPKRRTPDATQPGVLPVPGGLDIGSILNGSYGIPLGHDLPQDGGITGRMPTGGFFPGMTDQPQQPVMPADDRLHPSQSATEKYAPLIQPNQRAAASPATINANASEKPNDVPIQTLDPARFTGLADTPKFGMGPEAEPVATVDLGSSADGYYPGMDDVVPDAVDPIETRRKDAYNRRADLQVNGPQKEDKFWKRMLRGALAGVGAGHGLGGAIGGAATGAALGGFFPQVDQAIRKPGELAQVNQEIAGIEGERNADQKYRRGEVERQNILEDNRRLREQGEARMDAKKKEGTWKALNRLVQQKHYDPNNPAHVRLATEAGVNPETLQGWDDRNPVTKQVAGVTYQLNRGTGSYEPTNLPADEAKVLTDYEVTMPNGEKRKYKVAQKDAANFSTQMSTLGAKFEENARQREFQAGENEKTRQQSLISNSRQAADTINAIRQKGQELFKTEEEIEATIEKFKKDLPEAIRRQIN